MAEDREKAKLRTYRWRARNLDKVREISKRSNAKRRQDPETAEAIKSYQVRYRKENASVLRDKERQRKFGISRQQYAELYHQQNGVCAICENPEKITRSGKVRSLAVDHCHQTGKIRGLLCSDCNTSIGKFNEDRNVLLSAIRYLDLHSEDSKSVVNLFDTTHAPKDVKNGSY